MTPQEMDRWMGEALAEAARARDLGDVPIGAIVVRDGVAVARAFNRRIIDSDPAAHAEMLAIRAAAAAIGDWRLTGCSMVVTLEPCCMCAGAIVLARMDEVIFGASDPKAGACGTLYDICRDGRLNHQCKVTGGVRAQECGAALTDFFRLQRAMGKK